MKIQTYTSKETKELIEKWAPVIEGEGSWKEFNSFCPVVENNMKPILAQSLENCATYELDKIKTLLSEQVPDKNGELTEQTAADAIGDYKPILIPMLRRVIPAQIGPRIFGTWPMTASKQQIFALRSTFQNTTDYPVKRTTSTLLTLSAGAGASFTENGDISSEGTGVGKVRHIEDNNLLVEIVSGTFIVGENVDNVAAYVGSKGTISAKYDNEAQFKIIFTNYAGLYDTADGEALTTDMKELGFKIDTTTIEAQTYKIKTKWTAEVQEDLAAIHSINAEQLLTSIATEEIDLELNQEVLKRVKAAAIAGGTVAWDYQTADGRWELEKYQNLMAVISRVKRQIAVATRRGQATFMIVSPGVLAAIEHAGRLDDSLADPAVNTFVGRALGMDVFCDIYATNDDIYMGYKGNHEMDAGIFYGIYKPITSLKTVGEESGQPRAFYRSRVGFEDTLLGVNDYYRRITVANLAVPTP